MYKSSLITTLFLTASLSFNGCFSDESHKTTQIKKVSSLQFTPLELAKSDEERKSMRLSKELTLIYSDGSRKTFPLSYKILAQMGDKIGENTLALLTDKNGVAIRDAEGKEEISDAPDGNSLINVGDKSYLITHMEERPGSLYATQLKIADDKLIAVNTKAVDLSSVNGTIINCASSKTDYGSHLGGEEDYALNSIYADTASPFYVNCALDGTGKSATEELNYFCKYVDAMQRYLHDHTIDKTKAYNGELFSPYNYGYIIEVAPQADGSTQVAKHYVTGKYTPELAVMMPDKRTLYMSDDGTAKGFYKFVSDKAITKFTKEWEGTLYAAKLTQISAKSGGDFDLSWIKLGHAKDSEIKAVIDSKIKLSDIFDIQKPNEDGKCPAEFKKIYEDAHVECLRLKPSREREAGFLESRKYAAYLGATTEFRKEEGITYDPDKNLLYLSMSEITNSMEDNYKKSEPSNQIKLEANICGGVYEIALDQSFNATKMRALISGQALKVGEKFADEWACAPNLIANPDNITYIGHDTLLISEDTTRHINNFSWAYNTNTHALTRIASLPIGAEVTGVEKGVINSKALLFMNIQHPFKDIPKAADGSEVHFNLIKSATDEELKAVIGYIDGIPKELFE